MFSVHQRVSFVRLARVLVAFRRDDIDVCDKLIVVGMVGDGAREVGVEEAETFARCVGGKYFEVGWEGGGVDAVVTFMMNTIRANASELMKSVKLSVGTREHPNRQC